MDKLLYQLVAYTGRHPSHEGGFVHPQYMDVVANVRQRLLKMGFRVRIGKLGLTRIQSVHSLDQPGVPQGRKKGGPFVWLMLLLLWGEVGICSRYVHTELEDTKERPFPHRLQRRLRRFSSYHHRRSG